MSVTYTHLSSQPHWSFLPYRVGVGYTLHEKDFVDLYSTVFGIIRSQLMQQLWMVNQIIRGTTEHENLRKMD
jgi:hypothetical protein